MTEEIRMKYFFNNYHYVLSALFIMIQQSNILVVGRYSSKIQFTRGRLRRNLEVVEMMGIGSPSSSSSSDDDMVKANFVKFGQTINCSTEINLMADLDCTGLTGGELYPHPY